VAKARYPTVANRLFNITHLHSAAHEQAGDAQLCDIGKQHKALGVLAALNRWIYKCFPGSLL